MSDESQVFAGIEGYLTAQWTVTKIGYPNTGGVDVTVSNSAAELKDGRADFVEMEVRFGKQAAREVGGTSKQCLGNIGFLVHVRKGKGDAVLLKHAGDLVDLFAWKVGKDLADPALTGVQFTEGRMGAPFDDSEKQWRVLPCTVSFYFNKS